jgi:hypothetical protein
LSDFPNRRAYDRSARDAEEITKRNISHSLSTCLLEWLGIEVPPELLLIADNDGEEGEVAVAAPGEEEINSDIDADSNAEDAEDESLAGTAKKDAAANKNNQEGDDSSSSRSPETIVEKDDDAHKEDGGAPNCCWGGLKHLIMLDIPEEKVIEANTQVLGLFSAGDAFSIW